LCKRYSIDNSHRELHGALLDAEILADVYLLMTGGQASLLDDENGMNGNAEAQIVRLSSDRPPLKIMACNDDELQAHHSRMAQIRKAFGGETVWDKLDAS
jgi:DNA polymerase-3 subunit epsilon